MKNILNFLKKNRIPIPINVGLMIAKIPYSSRPGLGKLYKQQQHAIQTYQSLSEESQENYIYQQFIKIFTHAFNNVKFYNDLYNEHNLTPEDIQDFDDIQKVPIVQKSDLMKYSIEDRSFPVPNRLMVNTGGSSGKPFSFYMDPNRYGNEWAHVHDMWHKLGFHPSDLKMSFDGRAKKNNEIVYDFARNSLLYDIYAEAKTLRSQLLKIIKKHPIKYLHGYPSAIYEFAIYCEQDKQLLTLLREHLRAVFLSSEFPSPHYRKKIEEVFQIPTQSFYGHTETCILAVEDENFIYKPYQTYGFAEAINIEGQHHLIGTSYFNYASPLIRYDTSDLIKPVNNTKILEKFSIKEGRSGEFIIDKNYKNIPLTGLIYGRHHELFNNCQHIQVYQEMPGKATIYYVTSKDILELEASKLFDSKSVEIDFNFKKIDKPFLTSSGKANLLIKPSK